MIFVGIKYQGSKFFIDIHREYVYVACIRLNMKQPLEMTFENGTSIFLRENQFCIPFLENLLEEYVWLEYFR